ncbi:MAG: hypothetical protein AAF684_10925, partial [Pseudomonadota bacterium]
MSLVANAMVGATILGLTGFILAKEIQALERLNEAAKDVRLVGELSKATIELSLERSLTQVALNLDDPIAPAIDALLQRQRANSGALFDGVREQLTRADHLADQAALIERLDRYRGGIRDLRAAAAPLLAQRIDARDATARVEIPENLKTAVFQLDSLSMAMRGA